MSNPNPQFAHSITLSASQNQIVAGPNHQWLIDFQPTAIPRSIKFQDPGANDSVVFANAKQTLTNKSFGKIALVDTNTINANATLNIKSGALVQNATITFPAPANQIDTVAYLATSQTFAALQTFAGTNSIKIAPGNTTGWILANTVGPSTDRKLAFYDANADSVVQLGILQIARGGAKLSTDQSGSVIYLDSDAIATTLPAPAPGLVYTFIVARQLVAPIAIVAGPLYGQIIAANAIAIPTGMISAKSQINIQTAAAIGDRYVFNSDGTNWYVNGYIASSSGATAF